MIINPQSAKIMTDLFCFFGYNVQNYNLGDDNAQYYIIQKFSPSSPQTGHGACN